MIELTSGAESVEAQFSAFQAEVADLFSDIDAADAEALQRVLRLVRERIDTPQSTTT